MAASLRKRQPPGRNGNDRNTDNDEGSQTIVIIAIVAVCIFITAIVAAYITLRRLRTQGRSPKFLPGKLLKRKWDEWQPKGKYRTVNSTERGESGLRASTENRGREEAAVTQAVTAGVERNTSVRSVMTLPAYSQTPKATEQVIGREGERAGMDTVVEFPETAEEEDAARDAEMESLYQIRQARRREISEREERRRQRREARDRGDWARLEELRQQSGQRTQANNASTGNLTADILIAEHQSRPKDRRVSRVAYADVGQVRHDGTRLRANSAESERGGLLEGAAPMGENTHGRNASANSLLTLNDLARPNLPFAGGRQRSDSGALSISTVSSIDIPQATPATTEQGARSGSDEQISASTGTESVGATRFTPPETDRESEDGAHIDPRIVSMIRDSDNDISRPPQYEHHEWGDAPAYEERMRRAESQRTARLAVPTINVQRPSEPSSSAMTRVSEDHAR